MHLLTTETTTWSHWRIHCLDFCSINWLGAAKTKAKVHIRKGMVWIEVLMKRMNERIICVHAAFSHCYHHWINFILCSAQRTFKLYPLLNCMDILRINCASSTETFTTDCPRCQNNPVRSFWIRASANVSMLITLLCQQMHNGLEFIWVRIQTILQFEMTVQLSSD